MPWVHRKCARGTPQRMTPIPHTLQSDNMRKLAPRVRLPQVGCVGEERAQVHARSCGVADGQLGLAAPLRLAPFVVHLVHLAGVLRTDVAPEAQLAI